jgi:hypothetical protein
MPLVEAELAGVCEHGWAIRRCAEGASRCVILATAETFFRKVMVCHEFAVAMSRSYNIGGIHEVSNCEAFRRYRWPHDER